MKTKFGLFEIYYRKDKTLHKLARILSNDGETAMREAKQIFKAKLAKLGQIELCYRSLPLNGVTLKIKDPA